MASKSSCTHAGEARNVWFPKTGWIVCCPKCDPAPKPVEAPYIGGVTLSDRTRDQFRPALGKKRAAKLQTAGDVEKELWDFSRRYPHLQKGYKKGRTYDTNSEADVKSLGRIENCNTDGLSGVNISDGPENRG